MIRRLCATLLLITIAFLGIHLWILHNLSSRFMEAVLISVLSLVTLVLTLWDHCVSDQQVETLKEQVETRFYTTPEERAHDDLMRKIQERTIRNGH